MDDATRENRETLESTACDVNTAGKTELGELPGVSSTDAAMLVSWRDGHGPFATLRQAAAIPGLSPPAADAVLSYCRVGASKGVHDWFVRATVGSAWNSTRLDSDVDTMKVPDFAAGFEAGWMGNFRAGAVILARPGASGIHAGRPDDIAGLIATGPVMVPDPSAFWFTWERRDVRVTVGTFQVGFSNGLTLDTTGLRRPDGHYPYRGFSLSADGGALRAGRRFSGAAVTFAIPAGGGRMVSGTVFASYSFLDPPRSEVRYDRCPSGEPDCPESDMLEFVRWSNPAAPSPAYLTMTNVLRECTAGANIGFVTDAWRVEATGWATGLRFRPDATRMESAESSPLPDGRRIAGAAGVAASAVLPLNGNFAAEVAINDRAAAGAVAEASVSPVQGLDLEPSFRYYGTGWDNPWTGSTADAMELNGNRARDEIGARMDITWRSSRWTRNRLRLDAARHGPDKSPDSRPSFNLDAVTGLHIFASSFEQVSVEFGYRDRDLAASGRRLSWEPYWSEAAGNLSGGCRFDWTVAFRTTRIPKTTLTIHVSQAVRDSATLESTFDIDMAAAARIDVRLQPGPAASAFFRWSDESLTGDGSTTTRQSCAGGTVDGYLPGVCRGDARLDAGLGLDQQIRYAHGAIRLRLGARYTRHIDERASWASGGGATGRNDFSGALSIEFEYSGRTGPAAPNQGGNHEEARH